MHDVGLGEMLVDAARHRPDRAAIFVGGNSLNYRELFEQAGSIAALLSEAGVQSGQLVAVFAHRTITAYTAILAALVAGCGYVPLNPAFSVERNRLILRASQAQAIIVADDCASVLSELLDESTSEVFVITPESDQARLSPPNRRLTKSDRPNVSLESFNGVPFSGDKNVAYLLFTSGTTGVPKGVPISQGNLKSYLRAIHPLIPLTEEDRVLQAVDLTFDLSVHDMMLTWLSGGELYCAGDNAAILAPRLISKNDLTACLLVPSAAARAAEYGVLKPGCMDSLRYSLFAGEALPVSTMDVWRKGAPSATIFNLYGPTEGTIHTSWYKIDHSQPNPASVVPIGWPLGDQRLMLLDRDGREVLEGESGEIYLTGPQMTAGYWQAPHLDEERFRMIEGERWYKTGDLGRHTQEHGIMFAGRADRQVKVRGYRVELQEVEGTLRKASGRYEVAVIAWPLTAEGNAEGLFAFVAGPAMNIDTIRRACQHAMPPYMVPDRIEFLETLPLNANGKVDYKV